MPPGRKISSDDVSKSLRKSDVPSEKKARGAFFTPPAIADYLAAWAVDGDPSARVLDPTCGESAFLQAASARLRDAGASVDDLQQQVFGVDIEPDSVSRSESGLSAEGLAATLLVNDFFDIPAPDQIGCPLPEMDAIIGNPPYIRYQAHSGSARKKSRAAALTQGVRLSGMASSWAALLVHACSFLKPDGRLAMVLPAELLTVGYAEPIRRWLRKRFAAVHLVMFERLQFEDVSERVILVIARGSGGCNAFSLLPVGDASDLDSLRLFGPSHFTVAPASAGKWTDLLLSVAQRQIFERAMEENCTALGEYGIPELGTVTGANSFFALSESTRIAFGLSERQLAQISPPGTKHLKGLAFTDSDWKALRDADEPVWLLHPSPSDGSQALRRYLKRGVANGVPEAYKCRIRSPWWRPPLVSPPDLFFTYMSHRYPRLVSNSAGVSFLNSMHGIRLKGNAPKNAKSYLPLLCLNSVTMLGAEIFGRSYGGGVLKMEPREAAELPVPGRRAFEEAANALKAERHQLELLLRDGHWSVVVERVDEVLLRKVFGLSAEQAEVIRSAVIGLREKRMKKVVVNGS
jgi:tRNA1(Val) A37 N6-methylase TrmN6